MLCEFIIKLFFAVIEFRFQIFPSVILFLAIHYFIIRPFFMSPLREIPGPYWNRVSSLPALNAQRRNTWIETVYNLHLRYGNVVLLSPNEISVNGKYQYIKEIYIGNFCKGKFYSNFRNHGHDNPFAELNNETHLKYKKVLMKSYQKSSVTSDKNPTRGHLALRFKKLLNRIRKDQLINESGATNVYNLFSYLAMDVILAFELGIENGTDFLESSNEIVSLYRKKDSMGFWTTLMPQLWNLAATKEIKLAVKKIEKWHLDLYNLVEVKKTSNSQSQFSSLNTLKNHGYHGKEAYSFITDNIFAGHRTTAIQLTYLCYELSRPTNKKWQKEFRCELLQTFGEPQSSTSTICELEELDKLPVLNAIINENLRVHSSIPGAEPRVVDRKYLIEINKRQILIPQGTTISCLPYAIHRQRDIFPSPMLFKPERWLINEGESEEEFKKRMCLQHRYMMPFGKGIRLCLGVNLANFEIKFTLANLYWHGESEISEDWCKIDNNSFGNPIHLGSKNQNSNESDEEKMVMMDSYTTRPLNDECWLKFKFTERL